MRKLFSNKVFNTINSVAVLTACAKATLVKDMKYKHGAVICYTDRKGVLKIVSTGYNKKGKHICFRGFRNKKYIKVPFVSTSIHAEDDCIRKLQNKINHRGREYLHNKNLMMLVVRFSNGRLCNSKPCSNCMNIINTFNDNMSIIKSLYYSDKEGLIRKISYDKNVIN